MYGFAGTLISIILGILAIIYSMIQNNNMVITNSKMIDSSEDIKETSLKLEYLMKGINAEQIILNENHSKFMKMIQNSSNGNEISMSVNDNKILTNDDDVINIVNKFSGRYQVFILYYFFKSSQSDGSKSYLDFIEYSKSLKVVGIDAISITLCLFIFKDLGIISKHTLDKSGENLKVEISETIKPKMQKFFDNYFAKSKIRQDDQITIDNFFQTPSL
ncbi:MAG: hypothetical protein K0R72_953 [Clostridia bacterium]|jgi:hypothetical protein|nr:hypothetical protein [Clostridia bacterium]